MGETKIFTLEMNASKYIDTTSKLKEQINLLSNEQKTARKNGNDANIQYTQNEITLKSLKDQYKQLTTEMATNEKQNVKTADKTKMVRTELNKEVNTIADAKAQIKALNKLKQNLNVNNEKEAKLLSTINNRVDQNTKFLRENGSAEDKRILNIGNYASALNGVNPKLAMFLQSGVKMAQGLKAQKTALQATNGSLKSFRIALLATGIGAIVVVLGALVAAFAKTQKGIDAINSVLTPLKVVFESLWGVAEKLGEGLVDAFSSPKKLLSDLLDFMEGQVTNRIKAFGDIWDNIWSGDFDKVGDNLLTVATGVEDVTGKIKDMATETNKMLDEAWQRGKRIADLDVQISTAKMTQGYAQAKLTRLLKEQELIAKDTSKSAKEQADAVEFAKQLTAQKLALDKHINDLEIERIKKKQKSSDTDRAGQEEYFNLLKNEEDFKTKAQADEMKFLGAKNRIAKQAQAESAKATKKAHNDVLKNLKIELDTYIEKNKKVLESDKELNQETMQAKLKIISEINRRELQALKKNLEFKNINEKEYNLAKLQLENEYQAQLDDIRTQWNDKQIADQAIKDEAERQKKATDLELELQAIEFAEMSKWEKKNEINRINKEKEIEQLAQDWENELVTDEQFNKRLFLINAKYKKKELDNETSLANAKAQIKQKELSQAQQSAHQIASISESLFGKSKAVSAGIALVDTYVATQKAYTSQLIAGDPSSVLRATLAGASALASGLANVKNIMSAGKGGGGASGGSRGSSFSRPTSATSPITSTATATPPTAQPQPQNVINNYGQQQTSMRVVNVARDTADVFNDEIMVENYAND